MVMTMMKCYSLANFSRIVNIFENPFDIFLPLTDNFYNQNKLHVYS